MRYTYAMKSGIFIGKTLVCGLLVFIIVFSVSSTSRAQYSGSTYKIEEAQVGAVGSDNELDGTAYQGTATVGDTVVGNVTGSVFQAYGGFETTSTPHLEMAVLTTTVNVGTLDPAVVKTGTAQFAVRSYLTSGYNVYTIGTTPTNENSDTIPSLASGGTSTPGTSQFGYNLRANTSPVAFGTTVQQVPDASFSFGQVDANYNIDGTFRHVNGERIAYTTSSSGESIYTMAYIFNVNSIQGAGLYQFLQSIVVVATY